MRFAVLIGALCALNALSMSSSVAYIGGPLLRAAYSSQPYVYSAHSSSVVTPTQLQYQTQDDLGQYAYGYAEPLSAKQEVRSLDGVTRGSYSYRDAAGKLQTVDYTADANGFHVAATNLPHAVAPAAATGASDIAEKAQQPQQLQLFRASEASAAGAAVAPIAALPAVTPIATLPAIAAITPVATASRDVHLAAARPSLVRLAERHIADGESVAADATVGRVQLSQSVDDTVAVAAAKAANLKQQAELQSQHGRLFRPSVVHTTVPVAYQPNVYSYSYPWRFYYY